MQARTSRPAPANRLQWPFLQERKRPHLGVFLSFVLHEQGVSLRLDLFAEVDRGLEESFPFFNLRPGGRFFEDDRREGFPDEDPSADEEALDEHAREQGRFDFVLEKGRHKEKEEPDDDIAHRMPLDACGGCGPRIQSGCGARGCSALVSPGRFLLWGDKRQSPRDVSD